MDAFDDEFTSVRHYSDKDVIEIDVEIIEGDDDIENEIADINKQQRHTPPIG